VRDIDTEYATYNSRQETEEREQAVYLSEIKNIIVINMFIIVNKVQPKN
jgi:hypothetical protein